MISMLVLEISLISGVIDSNLPPLSNENIPPPSEGDINNFNSNVRGVVYSQQNGLYVGDDSLKELGYSGYIIEFSDPPVIEKKTELERIAKTNKQNPLTKVPVVKELFVTTENVNSRVQRYEQSVNLEHETLKQKIFEISSKKILGEYKNTFNGIALNISGEEAKQIEKIRGVKKVWLNYKVNALLDDSVPLIQEGIPAGQLDEDGNDCKTTGKECLTGKGVKIAIIDTGVDYTHPDLGNGFIDEKRDFEKINSQNLDLYFSSNDVSQQISLDKNKMAYYSYDTIYIYDFDKKTTQKIIPLLNFEIIQLELKDDSLAYIASNNLTLDQVSLYFYNLTSGKNMEINNFIFKRDDGNYEGGSGSFAISNGKVIYLQEKLEIINGKNWLIPNIYVYDLNTKNKIQITNSDLNNFPTNPVISGDLIAYSTYHIEGYCYDKIKLYNIKTGETKEITTAPYLGGVRDLKGNKLLYLGCGKNVNAYYLYDLNNGEYKEIASPSENNLNNEMNTEEYRLFSIFSWINNAKIDDNSNLIFFSDDDSGNRISVYDLKNNKYVQINPVTLSGDFDVDNGKVCFISSDKNIHCHDYDPNYDYPLSDINSGNKIIGGYDFVNNDNDPMDDHGHGTHVAATAAGNGVLKGIAPDAQILAYKVLDSSGDGSWKTVISGIEQAVTDGTDIISMSLGGTGNPDDPVSTAIDNAVNVGVIAVIAAGNSGPNEQTIKSPGTARKAITVGASSKSDQLAYFSSRGPVVWTDDKNNKRIIMKPDIVAPGVNICAAQFDSAFEDGGADGNCNNDNNHVSISGTSMATPHVAGAVALLKQKNPKWVPEEIKAALIQTAKDLWTPQNSQGSGRINLKKAIAIDTNSPPKLPWQFYIYNDNKVENIYDKISFLGAIPEDYESLVIDYKKVDGSKSGVDNGINLVGKNDIVFEFNPTGNILESGEYIFKLQILKDGITKIVTTNIYFDTTLKKGWPKEIFSSNLAFIEQPTISDFDGDGNKDIIISYSEDGLIFPNILIYNFKGDILKSLSFPGLSSQFGALAGDFDNNGKSDILYITMDSQWDRQLNLYDPSNNNNQILDIPSGGFGTIISSDLNQDSFNEVFFVDWNGYLFYYKDLFPKSDYWSAKLFETREDKISPRNIPIYLNLDNDPESEILATTYYFDTKKTKIFAFNLDGSVVDNFPKEINDPFLCLSQGRFYEKMQAFCLDYSLNSFDFINDFSLYLIGDNFESTISDKINLNKLIGSKTEIFGATFGNFDGENYFVLIARDNVYYRNFVIFISAKTLSVEKIYQLPMLYNNGLYPIGRFNDKNYVFAGSSYYGDAYFVNLQGDKLQFTHSSLLNSIVISDVDNDNLNELISFDGSGKVYVRDLEGYSEKEIGEFFYDAQHSNCYDCNASISSQIPASLSKIENSGDIDVDVNLLVKIQKFVNNEWKDYLDVINSRYVISAKSSLNLAELFNNKDIIIPETGSYKLNATAIEYSTNKILTTSVSEFSVT